MSSTRRKAKPLETGLFRSKEEIDQETGSSQLVDMSPAHDVRLKRASFDLREDQIRALGQLKYRSGKRISDLAQEAIDDLLAKYA